ncbi:MAG: glucose 1-dehydrogenase [Solirubrobacterales bacterium]|nr:glucose 1-dehydrogenase [Solirubrobacterales bacterium]
MIRGRLAGKAAIITGAGSGFGRAAARRFVAEGARVVVADLSADAARETCAGLGDAAVAAHVDVADPDAVARMVEVGVQRLGSLDVLFSNAGVPEAVTPLAKITVAEWDRIIDVNLKALFLCAQAAAPAMRAGGGGSIIATGSIAARRARPGLVAYVASKAGVNGLARALALELAPDRIRVNVINPGPSATPMLQEFHFAEPGSDVVAQLSSQLPLGATIEPDDIASAAVYLASDEAARVTGLIMNVDAGRDL